MSENSNVRVITDSYGNKAVKVTYADPLTGETKVANVAYDSNSIGRGLPIFDDYAKFTTDIKKPVGWENMSKRQRTDKEMQNATKDLRSYLEENPQMKAQFTSKQLQQITKGQARIKGYTWHHNAQSGPNNMQLIPTEVHNPVTHIGEASFSGGK